MNTFQNLPVLLVGIGILIGLVAGYAIFAEVLKVMFRMTKESYEGWNSCIEALREAHRICRQEQLLICKLRTRIEELERAGNDSSEAWKRTE